MTGTVIFLDHVKGFGFIKPDDGTKDIYVHISGTMDKVKAEDYVYYDVFDGKRGPQAVRVRRIKKI
jgi:cold shock protein